MPSVSHSVSRAFFNSTRRKGLCRNRFKSLLSMRKPLLGDSVTPRSILGRTSRRHIDFPTHGSILTFALSKRPGGLMVSALDSGSSGPGSGPGRGHRPFCRYGGHFDLHCFERHYGMLRGQINMYLPPGHPIIAI